MIPPWEDARAGTWERPIWLEGAPGYLTLRDWRDDEPDLAGWVCALHLDLAGVSGERHGDGDLDVWGAPCPTVDEAIRSLAAAVRRIRVWVAGVTAQEVIRTRRALDHTAAAYHGALLAWELAGRPDPDEERGDLHGAMVASRDAHIAACGLYRREQAAWILELRRPELEELDPFEEAIAAWGVRS